LGNPAKVTNCSFVNCQALTGGAITIGGDRKLETIIMNSSFMDNTANYEGGAIYSPADIIIDRSLFLNNKAFIGGALALGHGGILQNSQFKFNSAHEGGAVFIYGINSAINNQSKILNCSFTLNSAIIGGGLSIDQPPNNLRITLQESSFQYNTASNTAGGIYIRADENLQLIDWKSNIISYNVASGAGNVSGGLFLNSTAKTDPQISLGNLIVFDNSPRDYYCNQQNLLLVCKEPQCPTSSCGHCPGICVFFGNATETFLCYAAVTSPVCMHGKCMFMNLPVCVCDSGWMGELCDVGSNVPVTSLWYFWVGLFGGLIVIFIFCIGSVLIRKRSEYTFIKK